jgi:hypothetical protein
VKGYAAVSVDVLLTRLIKLTRRREDFVTECFAATLRDDGRAAHAYWRAIAYRLSPSIRSATGPVRVTSQVSDTERSSRIDMTVSRAKYTVGVEHKLFAPQGDNQLPKYLRLPRTLISHLALVTADYQSVATDVLRDRRYVRPSNDHFLWSDFYPIVAASATRGSAVGLMTKDLFDSLGLQPMHPLIGDLWTRDPARRRHYDGRLRAAWEPLLKTLRKRWDFADSSIRKTRRSEIYVRYGPSKLLRDVWLNPLRSPGYLLIRLKTSSLAKRTLILSNLIRARGEAGLQILDPDIVRLPPSASKNDWAIELRAPWRRILGRAKNQLTLANALKRFIRELMRDADRDSV